MSRQLAARMGNSVQYRANHPLSNDEMARVAPSMYALNPGDRVQIMDTDMVDRSDMPCYGTYVGRFYSTEMLLVVREDGKPGGGDNGEWIVSPYCLDGEPALIVQDVTCEIQSEFFNYDAGMRAFR